MKLPESTSGLIVINTDALWPEGISGRLKVWTAPFTDVATGVDEAKSALFGSVACTVTPVAVSGPLLVTLS